MSGERRTLRSWPLARLAAKVHPVCRSGDLALYRRRRHLRVRDALDGFEVGAFARLLFKLELALALQSLRLEAFVIADDAGKHGLVTNANASADRVASRASGRVHATHLSFSDLDHVYAPDGHACEEARGSKYDLGCPAHRGIVVESGWTERGWRCSAREREREACVRACSYGLAWRAPSSFLQPNESTCFGQQ